METPQIAQTSVWNVRLPLFIVDRHGHHQITQIPKQIYNVRFSSRKERKNERKFEQVFPKILERVVLPVFFFFFFTDRTSCFSCLFFFFFSLTGVGVGVTPAADPRRHDLVPALVFGHELTSAHRKLEAALEPVAQAVLLQELGEVELGPGFRRVGHERAVVLLVHVDLVPVHAFRWRRAGVVYKTRALISVETANASCDHPMSGEV